MTAGQLGHPCGDNSRPHSHGPATEAVCVYCVKRIVQERAGWRSDERDMSVDRVRCVSSPEPDVWRQKHEPGGLIALIALPAVMRRVSVPWSDASAAEPVASTPLCLGCGEEVQFHQGKRKWATRDGSTVCSDGGLHRVEQVVPDQRALRTGDLS
jgi:hypothetical protein